MLISAPQPGDEKRGIPWATNEIWTGREQNSKESMRCGPQPQPSVTLSELFRFGLTMRSLFRRDYVTASLKIPGFSIQWKTTRFTIARACDLAYGVGTNQVSFNDESGNRLTLRGKAVTIWRTDSGGAWKCVVDIWK